MKISLATTAVLFVLGGLLPSANAVKRRRKVEGHEKQEQRMLSKKAKSYSCMELDKDVQKRYMAIRKLIANAETGTNEGDIDAALIGDDPPVMTESGSSTTFAYDYRCGTYDDY